MYNITARGIIFIAITFSAFVALFSSCAPAATYFTLTEEGNYDWTPGPSVDNEEHVLAYQHEGSYMLAKNSVANGLKPVKKVIAVGQTQFTNTEGKTVACLAFKAGKNFDGPWEILTYKGETVVSVDKNVTSLPSQIIAQADSLVFVR